MDAKDRAKLIEENERLRRRIVNLEKERDAMLDMLMAEHAQKRSKDAEAA